MTDPLIHPASYRDPSGFVFRHNDMFYRQVNNSYSSQYRLLMDSGLYDTLTRSELMITHTEIQETLTVNTDCYTTLLPRQIPFISYPYEWSFDMLRDAAILTLKINTIAIGYGMILKDATAFNIQFLHGKPVFIDTLSFEKYNGTEPWIAYRQFCELFLFPLYLSHYVDGDMIRLLSIYPDGIPVQTAARLLPFRSKFNLGVWMHVYLQKSISQSYSDSVPVRKIFTRRKLLLLLDGLRASCKRLKKMPGSAWSNYYSETILSKQYLAEKEKIVRQYLDAVSFRSVIDMGANDGHFSLLAMQRAQWAVSTDLDGSCINTLYNFNKKNGGLDILPLIVDISNPTPAIGFRNSERASFAERAHADLLLALAVIHHLCLSKNIPLPRVAEWVQSMADTAIIEFVPREDIRAKKLLSNKVDIFGNYSEASFESCFSEHFNILDKQLIPGTVRILYLMVRKS